MQRVTANKSASGLSVRQRSAPELPAECCFVRDVERHIVRLIVRDWERLQFSSASHHWETAGELLDAITVYLVEHLMFETVSAADENTNSSIGLWHRGRILKIKGDKSTTGTNQGQAPSLHDILYIDDLSELDFTPNDTSFHSDSDEQNLSDFKTSRDCGYSFLSKASWTIVHLPKVNISAFSAYTEQAGLRSEWEFDEICSAWKRIKDFSGGELVFKGRHPSKIADKILPELQRVKFNARLPRAAGWRKKKAQEWRDYLLTLPEEKRKIFSRADLAKEITGSEEISKPIRNLWDEIKRIAPQNLRQQMEARGPKKKRS